MPKKKQGMKSPINVNVIRMKIALLLFTNYLFYLKSRKFKSKAAADEKNGDRKWRKIEGSVKNMAGLFYFYLMIGETMQLSEFTLKLLFLFLPGVISRLIMEKLTVCEEKRHFYFILYSFVFGMLAYVTYFLILQILGIFLTIGTDVKFIECLFTKDSAIDNTEIFIVSSIAVILGFVLSFIKNEYFLYEFARKLGVTKRFAEIDVWGYINNSDEEDIRWVRIRDHKNDLCYEGWVDAFSDSVKDNELFIRDVKVFRNSSGNELYFVPGMYLSRNVDEITIEYHALGRENQKGD